jgi:hypothetical protein
VHVILITVCSHICGLFDMRVSSQPENSDEQRKRPLTATSLAYLSSIPRLTVSAPFPEFSHSLCRRACSSSPTSQLIVLFSESMIILSPLRTSAIGPPRRASGTTCPTVPQCQPRSSGKIAEPEPMIKPRDAPEKRPSVMSAVEPARPAPINAPVGPWQPSGSSQHQGVWN